MPPCPRHLWLVESSSYSFSTPLTQSNHELLLHATLDTPSRISTHVVLCPAVCPRILLSNPRARQQNEQQQEAASITATAAEITAASAASSNKQQETETKSNKQKQKHKQAIKISSKEHQKQQEKHPQQHHTMSDGSAISVNISDDEEEEAVKEAIQSISDEWSYPLILQIRVEVPQGEGVAPKVVKTWKYQAVGCGMVSSGWNATKALSHGCKIDYYCFQKHVKKCLAPTSQHHLKLFWDLYVRKNGNVMPKKSLIRL